MVATSVSLDELLAKKLNAFQKKVIDLSSRNPLVNTNLSLRSAAIVRVVDELPEVLAYYLRQQKTMSFRPLPPIEENNPKDEQNAKFKSYLDALKAEDEEYIDFMADQKGAQVASPEELEEAERKIRDKVRVILKLPPRKSKLSLNLEQHAIDNGVDPSYELPFSKDKDLDKHVDDDIQTLLLPNDLDRRLTNLLTKCRTWEEETGINAFHAAFGFLRWQDTGAKDRLINSPLILQPVKLELRRSARGSKFFVRADGDDYALNFVLYEKLKLELALELPLFGQGDKVEDYFAKVREAISGRDKWEVSRQVVFGVFPSAKMAIYHDLDPAKGFYANNQVINELILGRQRDYAETASPLYDLDQEDIERVVFPLVLSADSSQASAIYDALTGKNMALEGPPGTGKSQSIVNVIASALRKGLKVLFVAEKMAALEVVKSRLEAIGLGNFLLPLQANRSDRAQVIAGIRYRIEMPKPNRPFDATHLHGQFELARSRLKGYLALMDAPFGQSGLTVREVIGRFRATDETLPEAPKALESPDIQDIESLGETRARELLRAASDLEKAASDAHASAPYWQGVTVTDLDAFSAKRAKDLALELSVALSAALGRKAEMASFALDDLKDSEIEMALCFLGQMVPAYPSLEKGIIDSLKTPGDMAYLEDFICKCAQCQGLGRGLGAIMESPGDPGTIERLGQAIKLANDQGFKSLSLEACHQELEAMHQRLEGLRQDLANLGPVVAAWPLAAGYSMKSLGAAREFVSAYDSRVLTLRAQAPPDNVLLGQLQALASKGLSLKGEKDKLAGMFPLRAAPGKIPDPESLASAASELEKTGLLNRLSGGYRRAKALYLSLANTQGFVPARASQELRELAAYLSEKSALEQNPTLGSFFPSLYVGLDSDFSLMLASASYYQQINLRYPGILNQEIKNLLYSADSDLLASIPPLRCQGQENYPALAKAKGELETVYGQALATYEGLARLLGPGQANGQGFAQARPLVTADYQAINQFIASFSAQFPGLASQAPDYPGLGAAKTLFWLGQKYQELNNSLAADEKARSILGAKFQGPETSRESLGGELEAIKLIEGAGPNGQDLYRALNNERFRELPGILGDIQGKLKEAQKAMASLASLTGLDLGPAMEALDDADKPARAAALADDQAGLFAFSALAKAKERAVGLGLGWFVSAYESEGAPMKNLAKILEASIYRAMMLKVRETHNSELLAFTSQELNYQRESLAQSDNALAKWARQDLSSYLFDSARPPMGNSVGLKKDYTETALLLNEIGKKKQYIPVRALVSRAHKSLLELKPCWMMSPTAVSQYLTDESLSFDLGILDEASQMPPENAIPSLARCRQVIVVGDSNQLPPTTFFQKNVTGEFALDEDEGGESETIDESILDMAKSVYVPRSLLWHYRSRHSGLINFCNRVIYDDKLIVYPSPTEKRPDMGVSLKKVEGIYQKSINPKEVSAIVKAALDHMKDDPERSLGLVTFNERQRNVIIDQMERAIEANGYAMSYVESWKTKNDGLESFFVKNLENVQGDERDVIFISTVYGPDKADGKVAQRFGPVTGAAGRRRLNVLFSRAKQKIVTFTSMSPADIAAKDGDLTGTAMLKDWLGYCERGGSGQGLKPERPGADRALSLESFVQEKVQAMGYQVDSLVGTEGYKLDLAVKSDLCPLGYLMGLEGDGKSYSQSASTRDRDRSRPEVLTGLGWKLNRIWSSAWYANPGAELAALKQGMETRLAKAQEELAKLPRGPEPGSEPATLSDRQEGDATFPKRQMAGSPQPPDYLAFSNPNTEMAKVATEEKAELAAVGDLVKIRYLDSPDKTMDIRLTQSRNDPQQGLVSKDSPLGSAILDQEVEDEVQFLANNEVKTVLIVSIDKAHPKVPLAPILMGGKPNGDGANTPEPQQPGQGMDSDNQPSDGENGPPGDLLGLISVKPGEESLLLDQDYQDTLAEMAITLIDTVGPIKLETLSQAISWSHGFSRRGTAIDNAIKKAIGKKREKTTAPDKEIVYWPPNIAPGKATPFRGMRVSNISREFNHVPYPELLGLAKEIVATTADSAQVQAMAARLEIKRLTKGLRDRLGEALKAAQKT